MATYRRALLTSAYTGARSAARAGRPVRDDRLLGAVPTGRLAARDLDPRRRRSILVGHRRRRVHGGLRLRQLTRRRARRPPWRAAFAARFRGGQRRYRPIRLGLDRDLLRRLPRARRARAVFAGRVRLSLPAARRANDVDGTVAAAAAAGRRAGHRGSGTGREPPLRREHARCGGGRRHRRLVLARQPGIRRHRASSE